MYSFVLSPITMCIDCAPCVDTYEINPNKPEETIA